MNLFSLLNSRSKAITIGIIGAGKFATMFFSQALKIPSIHIVGVVDIHPENAKSNMEMVGWDPSLNLLTSFGGCLSADRAKSSTSDPTHSPNSKNLSSI